MYRPRRYFSGLSKTQKKQKIREMAKFGAYHWKDPRAYKGFKTDTYVKSRPSNYTRRFKKLFPKARQVSRQAVGGNQSTGSSLQADGKWPKWAQNPQALASGIEVA
jgi:hypothetical protein